jgi:hypothetical protein
MTQRDLTVASRAAALAAAAQAPVATRVVAEPDSAGERATNGHTEMPDISRMVTQHFAPPLIQRQDEVTESPADSGEEGEDEAESPEDDGAKVDELARLVLPEIKRLLQLDWERGRGRLGR